MGEGIGNHHPGLSFHHPVVPDRSRRIHTLLNISLFEDVFHALGMVGPDPCQEISLQFESYQVTIELAFTQISTLFLNLFHNTQEVLYVMTDLMGDDIGYGKITLGIQVVLHGPEKSQVNIHLFIAGAVEWSGGCLGETACRLGRVSKQNQLGLALEDIILTQQSIPYILGVCQNNRNKFAHFPLLGSESAGFLLSR